MKFISLHQHTSASVLDGLTNIEDMVARAKSLGMPGLGITDHGTMTGVFKFYKACKAQGVNPIIGIEFYVAKRSMADKEPEDRKRYHLTVLAKNMTGVKNLFKLSTLSYTDGFYYKPRIDERTLLEHKEGLIVLSGCHSSKISQFLVGDYDEETGECQSEPEPERAKKVALAFKQEFGDDFYLEIQTHGLRGLEKEWVEQTKLNDALIKLGKEIDVKVVLTSDSHYLDHSDVKSHEILLCVGTASNYKDEDRMTLADFDLSFPDPAVLEPLLMKNYGTTEYAENTIEINNKVNIEWEYGKPMLPKINLEGLSSLDYARRLVWNGMKKKCPEKMDNKAYLDEIKFELDTLTSMGFLDYMLIVAEYVNWAKDQGIGVGPSRGSACGSLVAYLMNITEIDPMDKGMLFERFINPDRPTVPDIDVDFEDQRRDEVVQHIKDVYGEDHVCNILILNYMKSRAVFKDVARVLEFDFQQSNLLSSQIIQSNMARKVTLDDTLNEVPSFKEEYEKGGAVKEIVDEARKLEGKPRQHGVHACGILITPDPLVNFIPLEVDKDGNLVSQFPPEDLEELGLVKFDFLGLSTISVIQNTLKYIPELNSMYDIPQDDEKTFKTFQAGKSYFTFQFQTPLSRSTCQKMVPEDIMGLSDVTAMARPGPMPNIPIYARRKAGEEEVSYLNKIAEKYFSNTYGVNCYQEQGMKFLQEAADFTRGETDSWRKAVAKGKHELLIPLREKFIKNAPKITGNSPKDLEKWWDGIVEGGSYTFNLAHSYAYALIGYYTGYLLTNYPTQYMAAVMNNEAKDADKLAECFSVCKELGIKVLPPDVNKSEVGFTPLEDGSIVYGLSAIKGMGKPAETIISMTREHKPKTLAEFLNLFDGRTLNKTKLVALANGGALDSFVGGNRLALIDSLEDILAYKERYKKAILKAEKKQLTLGEIGWEEELPLKITKETPNKKDMLRLLELERLATGSYISGHPLDYFNPDDCLLPVEEMREKPNGPIGRIYGVIYKKSKDYNWKSGPMFYLGVEWRQGSYDDFIVFPNDYKNCHKNAVPGKVVRITVERYHHTTKGGQFKITKIEDLANI